MPWTFQYLNALVLAGCFCQGSQTEGSMQIKGPAGSQGHPTSNLSTEAAQPEILRPEQQAEVSFCGLHLGDRSCATEPPRTPLFVQASQPWEAHDSPQGSVYFSASETGSQPQPGKTILAVAQKQNMSQARHNRRGRSHQANACWSPDPCKQHRTFSPFFFVVCTAHVSCSVC